MLRWFVVLVGLVGLIVSPGRGESALDSPCPVDWRGLPLSKTLTELAGRLEVPCVRDASVDADVLRTPVRLFATHLTGRQVFRWLARLGGLEAMLIDGSILITRTHRLPATWRQSGTVTVAQGRARASATRPSSSGQARVERADARRIDVTWVDMPLSRVIRDVSGGFGIDLIVHPAILVNPPLLRFERAEADLDTIRETLSVQLDASVECFDGALWARPKTKAEASQPAASSSMPHPESTDGPEAPRQGLAAVATIDRSVTHWQTFSRRLAEASGFHCRVANPAPARFPGLEARGAVGEILEGVRLLGWLSWGLEATGLDKPAILRITVRQEDSKSP